MRIGALEGSQQEIKGLFEDHGLRLEDYLERPEARLEKRWLVAPISIVALALVGMVLLGSISHKLLILLFLLGLAGGTWLTVSIQIRFRNAGATFAVAVGVVLMLLVGAGLISPQETVEYLRRVRQEGP
jgi:hypothetical protein